MTFFHYSFGSRNPVIIPAGQSHGLDGWAVFLKQKIGFETRMTFFSRRFWVKKPPHHKKSATSSPIVYPQNNLMAWIGGILEQKKNRLRNKNDIFFGRFWVKREPVIPKMFEKKTEKKGAINTSVCIVARDWAFSFSIPLLNWHMR